MPIIILAGGLGTRISEETMDKPKPMALIGKKPILWHLMNIFASQGYHNFVIATGYKSTVIEDWVSDLNSNWKINAVYTGEETQTGGRIAQCMKLFPEATVMVTYGDGLANIDIAKLLAFHESHGKLATFAGVRPPARFGVFESIDGLVTHFGEKNQADSGWINGGFFVLNKQVVNYILNNLEPFETGALPRLVSESNLMAYFHNGFWQPMDTLREKIELTKLAEYKVPPWLVFE